MIPYICATKIHAQLPPNTNLLTTGLLSCLQRAAISNDHLLGKKTSRMLWPCFQGMPAENKNGSICKELPQLSVATASCLCSLCSPADRRAGRAGSAPESHRLDSGLAPKRMERPTPVELSSTAGQPELPGAYLRWRLACTQVPAIGGRHR
jgi:hypothetical protein